MLEQMSYKYLTLGRTNIFKNLPNYCYIPNLKIVDFCKKKIYQLFVFRGINENYKEFNSVVKPHGLNIDYDIDPSWAKENLKNVVLQGGLDPKTLLSSKQEILKKQKII